MAVNISITRTGAVDGPSSAVDEDIAVFDGIAGNKIKDGAKTIAQVLDRANHTGTQTAATISDFDTEVSNNTDVAANTSARHSAVTVTDSTEIDFTLSGQDITASIKAGSIDETKLDVSTNASLDLADSATQPGDLSTVATSGDHTDLSNIGTNTHAQIDTHIASTSNPHTVTATQISDFDTEVANNTDVAANTTHRSSDGTDHSHVGLNDTHRASDGTDHSHVVTNDAKISCTTANVTSAGALMDSEVDADIKTLSLPANTTISAFGASLIDDADAGTARTTLGVDASGTDNSTNVTLAGTPDYLTLSGQEITLSQIDLTADVTGNLPDGNIASSATWDAKMADLTDDLTPQLSAPLDAQAHTIGFTQQSATGDGTTTIVWNNGNKFKFTFGAYNETFTFTAPTKVCNLLLVMKQDGTGSRTATWPATVKWPGGTAPTLSTAANSVDIISFYYDGTNYYGVASLDFS